jgi:hypothetical protein
MPEKANAGSGSVRGPSGNRRSDLEGHYQAEETMQPSFLTLSPNAADEKALRIHYMEEKPENAKGLIIFLHGFSQFWYI